jgi:hypothetical protein
MALSTWWRPNVDGGEARHQDGNRTEEAVATGADQIAVACPFCRVMLSDALRSQQAAGSAPERVEVVDVRRCCWPPSGAKLPPDTAALTPCAPEES